MKTSEVFKKAKHNLAQDAQDYSIKQPYICYSIEKIFGWNDKKSDPYVKIILSRLNGFYSLENWLEKTHGIKIEHGNEYKDKIQETRHRWVDSLIAEFQAKGD